MKDLWKRCFCFFFLSEKVYIEKRGKEEEGKDIWDKANSRAEALGQKSLEDIWYSVRWNLDSLKRSNI